MTQFKTDLLAMMQRQALSEARAAGLLGVPVYTLRKWTAGQRAPSAAAVQLLAVLGTLEALAPAVLAALMPAPDAAATTAPPKGAGRPKKQSIKAPN
jgi:transcriptional regulator with XRE-family HTH domain